MNEEVEEEEVEIPFEDTSPIFSTTSSSRAEPIDISSLQPFIEVLIGFLDNTTLNPLAINHPVPNIPFQ